MQEFPDFPIFVNLSLDHKNIYNQYILKHPPYSDILFATLQIWWNLGGKLSVSSLSGNLVINYYLPFDSENSGYGLIGEEKIDESISDIFKHLKREDRTQKLVHVPEFTLSSIVDTNGLLVQEEKDYGEYILDTNSLANLQGKTYARLRQHINIFNRYIDSKDLEIKSIDLTSAKIQAEVMNSIYSWEDFHPTKNDPKKTEHLALKKSLSLSKELDLQNMTVYINGQLCGISIYHKPERKKYYILHHLKVDYDVPYLSDYIHRELALIARDNGVKYLNIEMDLGIENLRIHKMGLKPHKFFKKYTITPI